jgi:hypothetical protein
MIKPGILGCHSSKARNTSLPSTGYFPAQEWKIPGTNPEIPEVFPARKHHRIPGW